MHPLISLIGMDQPVQSPFVLRRVKIMAHVQRPTFVIGNCSDIFFSHLLRCNCLSAQAHGMAVFVKHVRNRAHLFFAISNIVHTFLQLSAILHASMVATAQHLTHACVSYTILTLIIIRFLLRM